MSHSWSQEGRGGRGEGGRWGGGRAGEEEGRWGFANIRFRMNHARICRRRVSDFVRPRICNCSPASDLVRFTASTTSASCCCDSCSCALVVLFKSSNAFIRDCSSHSFEAVDRLLSMNESVRYLERGDSRDDLWALNLP